MDGTVLGAVERRSDGDATSASHKPGDDEDTLVSHMSHSSTPSSPPLSATGAMSSINTGLLYVAFTTSGAAGLIYQVMWARSFSLIFGSTTRAAAVVLAAFFAGLALGSLLGARLAKRRSTAALRFAAAEVAVLIGALAVNIWFAGYERWYPTLYQSLAGSSWPLTPIKLVLAFAAIGPPCVAMGVTLPLMARALVARTGHFGSRVGLAYGLNTLGATAGVLLAGFVLPSWIGITNSMYLAAALNLLAAAAAGASWLTRDSRLPTGDTRASKPRTTKGLEPAIVLVVILSGFGTLALEVLYTRLIVNLTDSSIFSFSLMLATFLVFLAAGSLLVSAVVDRLANPWRLLAWTQGAGALAILVSPTFFQFAIKMRIGSAGESIAVYLLQLLLLTAMTIGPVVLLLGMALPIAWKIATHHASESGRRVGTLTGVNTLAAAAGSVCAGFVLLPWLGSGKSIAVVATMYALLALVAWSRGYRQGWPVALIVLGLSFAVLLTLQTWNFVPLWQLPGETLVRYTEGETANVAVIDTREGVRLLKVNNRYLLGSSGKRAVKIQRSQGGLPLLLHPRPWSVAFIGVATGVSVSSVLDFPVRRVVAIEIIPGVVDAASEFEAVNRGVLRDHRVETLVADARNHLFATDEQFDVIVGDVFVPWHAGTGYLYTTEHFAAVSRRLTPGGIFAQWLPGHQLSAEELRMITATFLDVFPTASLWTNPSSAETPLLALVSHDNGDLERRSAVESSTAFPGIEYVCDAATLRSWSGSALRNTDEYPRIEFRSAASHFAQSTRHLADILRVVETLRSSS